MKKLQSIGLITLCFLALGLSCKDSGTETAKEDNSPRIVKSTKLISPEKNASYTIGDTLNFEVESSGAAIDSIELEYEGVTKLFTTSTFDWVPVKAKTGSQKVKLRVFCGESSETHYPKFILYSDVKPEELIYKVLKTYPHNKTAYTQGLFFKDDTLIESTGQRGESVITKLNLETSEVYKSKNLDSQYFGEGSCYWNGKYIQLTWTSHTGFVYDDNFNQVRTFNYTHEGWGVTTFGDTLFISDGTEIIHMLDPRDFTEIGKLEVYNQTEKVKNLNELEMINGLLYANIWMEDYVAVIDPKTGKLLKMIDLAGLLTPIEARKTDVLNGIAHYQNRLFVTGKLWPSIFEIELIPKN